MITKNEYTILGMSSHTLFAILYFMVVLAGENCICIQQM